MRFLWLLMVWTVSTVCAFSAPPIPPSYPVRVFTIEQLKRDFTVLRETLEERHPSLYRYTSRADMSQLFDEVYRQLNRPMTEFDFRELLRPLIVQIRCGHTDVLESKAYLRMPDRPQPEWFPFDLILSGDRLFVNRNRSTDSSLIAGTEVTRLDGHPIAEVIAAARERWPSDGYNQTFKNYFLELYHLEDTYWRHFGGCSPWTLTVRDTTGAERVTTIRRRFPATQVEKRAEHKPWWKWFKKPHLKASFEEDPKLQLIRSLHFLNSDSSVAALIVNGFSYEKYESFHRDVFEKLAEHQVKDLVIDLRQNTGGNAEIGSDLMSYLMDKDFRQVARAESPTRHPNRCAYFTRKDKRMLRQNFRFLKKENGLYEFGKSNVGWNRPASENRFKGNIYILTSGRTFSAAAIFTASLRAQRPVVVVGQETGGGEAGCNGGIIQTLTLPETGLRVRFPVFWIATASTKPDVGRGVMPDHPVVYSVEDRIYQRDKDMEKVLQLIQSSQQKVTAK